MDVQQYNETLAVADAENPTGTWTGAPALAASTVAMKNTSGHAVMVDVTSGTVTVIKIGVVTTGATTGTFRLRRGESLSITYSVAPTLAWTYESPASSVPNGTWAGAPSLASSTVDMVNTSGFPVNVGISGGTYTVVKKSGVTLTGVTSANQGTVPALIRLRRGESINITYSVAPTLQWLFD